MNFATQKSCHVVAFDTSTDMLACATARVVLDSPTSNNAEKESSLLQNASFKVVDVHAQDHLCRRRANVELVNTMLGCLDSAHISLDDVDAVIVGRGPGSFTGVRLSLIHI